jgi:hypothetical protein
MAHEQRVASDGGWLGSGKIDGEAFDRALDLAPFEFDDDARWRLRAAMGLVVFSAFALKTGRTTRDVRDELKKLLNGLEKASGAAQALDRAPGLDALFEGSSFGLAARFRELSWLAMEARETLDTLAEQSEPADPARGLFASLASEWKRLGGALKAYHYPETGSAPAVYVAQGLIAALPDDARPTLSAKTIAERLSRHFAT